MGYLEQDIQDALQQYDQGKRSIRSLSKEFGIPYTTLHNRLSGCQPHREASEWQQSLSRIQEDRLAEWVLTQAALGVPATHAQIRLFGNRILEAQGTPEIRLGRHWMERFLKRHPVLRTQRARRIDSARVNGATGPVIQSWFQLLQIPAVKKILPANRYNEDEYGLMEGQGTNGLVVGSSGTRAVQRKDPGSRAWTSFIECISALGVVLPPAVILKGKDVQQQWFSVETDGMDDWLFTATENGWTDRGVALEWLERIFIPYTRPQDPTQARLLILDGHDSHTSDDFMWNCFNNNIHLVFLPAHTSHVLQPLDLSVFSPLKHTYRKHLNNINTWAESTVVGKQLMLKCILRARQEALTAQNAKAGWKASGLWPVSIAKPLMSRLLLENSNKSADNGHQQHPPQTPTARLTNRPALGVGPAEFTTPRKKRDRQSYLDNMTARFSHPSTRRLLFRKLEKVFDEKDYQLAQLRQENEALKARLEGTTTGRRKRVVPDPNQRFVNIEQIRRAQIAAGRVENPVAEESRPESPDEAGDCIVVG